MFPSCFHRVTVLRLHGNGLFEEIDSVANFNTYRSCLIPYENEIIALRRKKPPMPFSRIAEYLHERYQITVNRQAIYKFLKVRTKGYKTCKYAWNIELPNTDSAKISETPSWRKTQTSHISAKPTPPVEPNPDDDFDMPFSKTYNLTRMSPEEAAERLKKLKERNQQ